MQNMSREEKIALILDKLSKLNIDELQTCVAWMKAVETKENK